MQRKLIYLIIALFFLSMGAVAKIIEVAPADARMTTVIIGGGAPAAGSSYTFEETFSASGGTAADNTWTGSGGTWSIASGQLTLEDAARTTSITGSDGDVYFAWKQTLNEQAASSTYTFELNDSGSNKIIRLRHYWDTDHWYTAVQYNNCLNSSDGADSWGVSDTRYFKILYNNGSGSDGHMQAWISTDGQSGNWTQLANVTDITDTEQIEEIETYAYDETVVDDIRVSDSDINW